MVVFDGRRLGLSDLITTKPHNFTGVVITIAVSPPLLVIYLYGKVVEGFNQKSEQVFGILVLLRIDTHLQEPCVLVIPYVGISLCKT